MKKRIERGLKRNKSPSLEITIKSVFSRCVVFEVWELPYLRITYILRIVIFCMLVLYAVYVECYVD